MSLQKKRILCDALELYDARTSEKEKKQTAPKLEELTGILQEQVIEAGRKVVIFSSFEGMIDLAIARVAKPLGIGHVKLAGSVPTSRRGKFLDRFREDPDCRLFFATDAGGGGLNLQSASLVINLDVPWNPAVLEQSIGRAHRMGQKETVQVINLVAQCVIEERMLDTLAHKRQIFQAVLSAIDGEDSLVFAKDRGLMGRLRQMLTEQGLASTAEVQVPPGGSEGQMASPSTSEPISGGASAAGASSAPAASSASDAGKGSAVQPLAGSSVARDAESADADKARLFGERLGARLGGRLLLVRPVGALGVASPAAGDRIRLMVVVDQDAAGLSPAIDEVAAGTLGTEDSYDLHLFDRKSYESLLGLFGENLGAKEPAREVFRSPALPLAADRAADAKSRTAREVREKLALAGERLRLAHLMAGGGFAKETSAPLGQALDAVLDGLYKLSSNAPPADRTSILEIERLLVKPGIITPEDSARIPWLLGLLAAQAGPGAVPLEQPLSSAWPQPSKNSPTPRRSS